MSPAELQSVEVPPVVTKMSDKVLIKRYPDQYTLVGQPILLKDIEEAAEILAQNTWMRGWVAQKIKAALLDGEEFTHFQRMDTSSWKGRADGMVAEYRLATSDEVLNFVDTAQYTSVSGHTISKRAQERAYVLHYHEGSAIIEHYDSLPRQARTILDLLNATGRENFTEASITIILEEGREQLRTKQEPIKIFAYYKALFVSGGHLEEVEDDG